MQNQALEKALFQLLAVDQKLARMKAGATILPSEDHPKEFKRLTLGHPQGKYSFDLGHKKMEAKIRRRRRMR
jgi:hypothetical protein